MSLVFHQRHVAACRGLRHPLVRREALSEALLVNNTLREIILNKNNIGDAGADVSGHGDSATLGPRRSVPVRAAFCLFFTWSTWSCLYPFGLLAYLCFKGG